MRSGRLLSSTFLSVLVHSSSVTAWRVGITTGVANRKKDRIFHSSLCASRAIKYLSDPAVRPRSPGGRGKEPGVPTGGHVSETAEGGVKTPYGAHSSVRTGCDGKIPATPLSATHLRCPPGADRPRQSVRRSHFSRGAVVLRADRRLQSAVGGQVAGL